MEILADPSLSPDSIENATPPTRLQKTLKWGAWIGFTLFLLLVFTIIKLPEAKITNLIQGHLSNLLVPMGITLTAEESSFSLVFGPRLKMNKVRIYLPPPASEIQLDQLSFAPSVMPAFLGRLGGTLFFKQGKSEVQVTVQIKKTAFYYSFDLEQVNLGNLQLLQAFAKIKATGTLSGSGSGSGDQNDASRLTGNAEFKLQNFLVEQQTYSGGGIPLNIPEIRISEGKILAHAQSGKLQVKTLDLGKKGTTTDDLVLSMNGEVILAPYWLSSQLNLKTYLKPSERVMKAFLLDIVLGTSKQADGSYSFQLGGNLSAPTPTPIK